MNKLQAALGALVCVWSEHSAASSEVFFATQSRADISAVTFQDQFACCNGGLREDAQSRSSTALVDSLSASSAAFALARASISLNLSMSRSLIQAGAHGAVAGSSTIRIVEGGSADASWQGGFEVLESGPYQVTFSGQMQRDPADVRGAVPAGLGPSLRGSLTLLDTSVWEGAFDPYLDDGQADWSGDTSTGLSLLPGQYHLSLRASGNNFGDFQPYTFDAAVVLKPVPEPATLAILVLGLLGLGVHAHRSRHVVG